MSVAFWSGFVTGVGVGMLLYTLLIILAVAMGRRRNRWTG